MTINKLTLRVQVSRLQRHEARLLEEVARLKAVLADEREGNRRLRRLLKAEVKDITSSFEVLRAALLGEVGPNV